MQTDNRTNEEVDYEQNGGGVPIRPRYCGGRLDRGGSSLDFDPCGPPPWVVRFKSTTGRTVTSGPIPAGKEGATVTLHPDWRVTVS